MKFASHPSALLNSYRSTCATAAGIRARLSNPTMPAPLADWLARLALLHGVPFNYLVPDEAMLPPESIRFFYLDENWIAALNDGAMSIGRNLNRHTGDLESNLHTAVLPDVNRQLKDTSCQIRARAFGITAEPKTPTIISGFLLRSSAVLAYPSMGVNVYPKGATPSDPEARMLKILRFEQLGAKSDTLICLVDGDAYRVDLHEAPQALHYGIDCFNANCRVQGKPVTAVKNLYTFGNKTTKANGVTTNEVTMSKDVTATDISSCLRSASTRVLSMDALSQVILATNKAATPPAGTTAPTSIDSAAMGFEMTEGVGMVSFFKAEK